MHYGETSSAESIYNREENKLSVAWLGSETDAILIK